MNLSNEQFDILADFADQFDAQIVSDYSGRGMYGQTCIGFITNYNNPNLFQLGFNLCSFIFNELANNNDDDNEMLNELLDTLSRCSASTDSMGLDTIIYFPTIQYKDV